LNDPLTRATLRVLEQAPKRKPLQDTRGAVAPAAAPAATAPDEAQRVGSLAAPLQADLDALITDMSESPLLQRAAETLVDEDGDLLPDDQWFEAQHALEAHWPRILLFDNGPVAGRSDGTTSRALEIIKDVLAKAG